MTRLLHDGPGSLRWITVSESESIRYLELDGCEEGAMDLFTEEPVFHYLWFHKASRLVQHPARRALVLGAGAFTAAKCLALDHPEAIIDAVDAETQLGAIARQYFRLERPEFVRVVFHGKLAEDYLSSASEQCDFVFDDLFDGFQHVPHASLAREHFQHLRRLLRDGGVCVKNLIWDPRTADTRAACEEATAALREAFPHHTVLALGPEHRGHNRMLFGFTEPIAGEDLITRLRAAGMCETVLDGAHVAIE
jgi:spermidine synthase